MPHNNNILLLHEAIAVVLLNSKNRTATIEKIAIEIENRDLYKKKNGTYPLASQIRLRTNLSNKRYSHLFEFIKPNLVKLK